MFRKPIVTVLWLLCCLLAGAQHLMAAERPNILLLMAEDLSPRLATYGDSVAVTPNLDALAQQGVRYSNVFTTAGVCAPSRAAHILGMHQISTGTQHMRSSSRPEGGYVSVPPPEVKAYPELLRAAGYYTFTDGKLDYQFSGPRAGTGPASIWNSEDARDAGWRGRGKGQPFFGMQNFLATHESGIFRPLGSWPASGMHFMMQLMRWRHLDGSPPEAVSPADVKVPPYLPDTATVRADIARHYNNIALMDQQVGEVLEQLQADGLADSTIVIWTTDHGDGLPRSKRELFDSGIHVPMIIRWPEKFRPQWVEPGSVDQRMISFVDLAPTVLQLAGVDLPDYLHGRSIVDPEHEPRQYVYASRDRVDEVEDRQRAVRDARFKYIRSWKPKQPGATGVDYRDNIDSMRELRELHAAGKLNANQRQWFEGPGVERLFDLHDDPHELNDLSLNPEYKQDLQRLRRAMGDWFRRVGDWSADSEAEMVAKFQPDGEQASTPEPELRIENDQLVITPAQPGHSLLYRLNAGDWRLYSKPIAIAGETDAPIEAYAVRYGWKPSDIVRR